MKNPVLLLVMGFLFVSFLEASLNFENAFAQEPTADCEGTLRAWRMDPRIGPQVADQYYCPHRDRLPVLRQKKSPTTPRRVTPQSRRRTINWPALEAKYFAEADQKGLTQIWISSGPGGKKRYYRKENGNWVRISEAEAKHTTPEDQRKKERWAKEEMVRKKLLKKRQKELEREKELFELGKSDLLKTLKGARGEQGLGLKPAAKEKQIETLQTWKSLNDAVYWALSAAEKARNGAYGEASKYSEWSAQAKAGITSGYPEIDIPIPDVPRPAEANPQVKLYNLVIEETTKLIPVFQRTDKEIMELTERKKNTEERIAQKRKEIEELKKEPPAPLKEEGKKKGRALEEAEAYLKDVLEKTRDGLNDGLNSEISERADAEYELNVINQAYTTVQREPERAEEFLNILGTRR